MVRQFNRKEINERLHGKIAAKKPIVIGGAGIGLVAKIADQAGIAAKICSRILWVKGAVSRAFTSNATVMPASSLSKSGPDKFITGTLSADRV